MSIYKVINPQRSLEKLNIMYFEIGNILTFENSFRYIHGMRINKKNNFNLFINKVESLFHPIF